MATLFVIKKFSKFPANIASNSPFVRSISATAKVKLLPHHAKHSTFATICSTASPPNSYSSMTAPISLLSRPISTNLFSLAKSDGGQRTPTDESLDAFRATEEKIEREFEAKHKEDTSSGPQSQGGENDKEEERIQQVRCRILDAALPFVQSQGWSREAISSGAEKCGYPGVVHGMFPNGGAELVHHFYMKCNSQLIEQLKSDADARPADQPAPVPTEFIANAIKLRLQMIEPYIETWPKALAVMTLPQNVPTSLAQLLTLIDDICYYAGDRSVDFGWYTRRVGVATIYKMTEIYMLQDKSKDRQDTWQFLNRRIEDGVHVQEVLNASEGTTKNVAHAVGSAFQTARNILGINFNNKR